MLFETLNINFSAIMPEMLLTGLALTVLILDFFLRKGNKEILGYLSVAGLLVLLPVVVNSIDSAPSFGGTFIADHFSAFLNSDRSLKWMTLNGLTYSPPGRGLISTAVLLSRPLLYFKR